MSDTGKKNNNQRSGNRNNRNNSQGNRSGGGNRRPRNNNRKRYSQNKNRRPKSLTPSRILQKYDNLMEQYLIARRKFFDLWGRANKKNAEKADRNYRLSLKNLREFETNLKEDWQKDVLKSKIDAFPEDRQYTTEHKIEPKGDEVSFVGEFEDPHLLSTQKAQNWSEDSEETSGTIDDYYAYKGITPPAPKS